MPADPVSRTAPPPGDDRSPTLRHLVTVLVVIFVVAALKATKPVTLPLAFALFFVVLLWPLYRELSERLPRGVALVVTFLALLGVFAAFVGAVWFAADQVVEGSSAYRQEFQDLRGRIEGFARFGGDGSGGGADSRVEERVAGFAERIVGQVQSVLAYFVLILALFALAMSEVRRWRQKLRRRFSDPFSSETLDTAGQVTKQVQRFLLVQSLTSVLTGVLTGLWVWVLGVDFPFVWGLLAGVLNFIPTLGSIVAVFPPTLFALLQFGFGWKAPVVLVGLGLIQFVLGSYVDPKLQGRYLQLSALVIL
ncbi:MAG: AI-2E family transporter, partial [Rhodothermales bacterium]|nr:AI-2E family transporter [Rhodothermales bacterium]